MTKLYIGTHGGTEYIVTEWITATRAVVEHGGTSLVLYLTEFAGWQPA